jgi:hypothetical protein
MSAPEAHIKDAFVGQAHVVAPPADRVADGPEDLENQADDDAEHADAAEDVKARPTPSARLAKRSSTGVL